MDNSAMTPVHVQVRTANPIRSVLLAAVIGTTSLQPALADGPGRGATAQYERDYLVYVINHHYAALRTTELAAGTDRTRDAAVQNPTEGTSPTPEFGPTQARASDPRIRSLARQANRTQREEIGKAQHLLRTWYGVQYTPFLTREARLMIMQLERAPAGTQFDRAFLRMFSNHHVTILAPSVQCQVQSDLNHHELQRYCENIVVTQTNQINDMREILCKRFNECGFAPGVRMSMQTQEQD